MARVPPTLFLSAAIQLRPTLEFIWKKDLALKLALILTFDVITSALLKMRLRNQLREPIRPSVKLRNVRFTDALPPKSRVSARVSRAGVVAGGVSPVKVRISWT